MYLANQFEQASAVDQVDRFASREIDRRRCESSDTDALHVVRALVHYYSPHRAHDIHADLLRAPLLALHELELAVSAQFQIDAAVRATQSGFLNSITASTECLPETDENENLWTLHCKV